MLQKPEKGLHSGGCTAGTEAANLPAAVCRLSRTYYQSSEPRLTILAAGFAFINKGSQNWRSPFRLPWKGYLKNEFQVAFPFAGCMRNARTWLGNNRQLGITGNGVRA